MSVTQLAGALGLTPGGVRQQIAQLESAGTVVHEPGLGGRGRFFYSLATASAPERHAAYNRFVVRLLRAMESHEAGLLAWAVTQLCPAAVTGQEENTTEARVQAVRRAFEDDGFAPQVESLRGARFSLRLQSCPVADLAAEFGCLCDAEEQCLSQRLTGLRVERREWRLGGANECCYVVSEAAAG
jgi:predicted ArsR family transcriptional regulator